MNRRRHLLVGLGALCVSRIARSGAWGHRSFDNDGALDWVLEFSRNASPEFVRKTLNQGTQGGYLESPDGEAILAAAEFVAACVGRPSPDLPNELKPIVGKRSVEFKGLAPLARTSVAAVLGKESELRETWSQHADDFARWSGNVKSLLTRLAE